MHQRLPCKLIFPSDPRIETMSSSLDVSLDSLIEAKVRSGRGGGRGAGRGDRRNSGGRGGFVKLSTQVNKPRQAAPFLVRAEVTNSRVAAYTDGTQSRRAEQVSSLRQPFQKNEAPVLRQQQAERREKVVQPVVNAPPTNGSSIFDRLGSGTGLASGTSVTIQKLNKDIVPSDISDLCLTIGEVKSVSMQYDNAGQSTGRADVTFSKRSDALSCVQRFHNVALDGTPMHVQLTGGDSAVAQIVSAPLGFSTSSAPLRETNNSNVREGLFGTAFQGQQKEIVNVGNQQTERRAPRDPSFSVTMSGAVPQSHFQSRGPSKRRDEHDDRGDDAMPQTSAPTYSKNGGAAGRGQGRGSGARRGGGDRAGGRGGGRGGSEIKEIDLDNAMDAYMSNK